MTGWICTAPIYEYDGCLFEYRPYTSGPWPVRRKDYEPFKRAGDKFYNMIETFLSLPEKEQEKYRVGGGCHAFCTLDNKDQMAD